MGYVVLVKKRASNSASAVRLGQVRRLCDELGYRGIVAKRGETNRLVRSRGHLRTWWPTRRLARAYERLVSATWGHHFVTKRLRTRRMS